MFGWSDALLIEMGCADVNGELFVSATAIDFFTLHCFFGFETLLSRVYTARRCGNLFNDRVVGVGSVDPSIAGGEVSMAVATGWSVEALEMQLEFIVCSFCVCAGRFRFATFCFSARSLDSLLSYVDSDVV